MISPQERKMILKFLTRHYPVMRIKHQMRFKRAIMAEGKEYYISNKLETNLLFIRLLKTLKILFNTPDDFNKDVLKTFLHLK